MPNDRMNEMNRMDERRDSSGSGSGGNRGSMQGDRQNEVRTVGGQGSGTYQGGVPVMRESMPDTYREDFRDIYRGYRQDRMHKSEKNVFKNEKNYRPYNSADEIFEVIVSHLTKGVMFHDKMMDLYGFLGLYGFKKMHEYQYYCESIERRKAKCYVLDHMNLLVREEPDDSGLNFIPANWYEHTRHDITPESRKQYIAPSFQGYKQWEEETKDLLSYCANELMYMGQMSDFNEVMSMVDDVEEELRKLEDLMLKLKSVDFDMQYLMDMQEKICQEYEGKLEECFEEKIEHDKKKKPYIGGSAWGDMQEERRYTNQRRSSRTGRYIRG